MRAYIPPEVYAKLDSEHKEQWDKGTVARMLLAAGIPYIGPETIPLICYRMNMLQYADVCCKVAQGMRPSEIDAPAMVEPAMLAMYRDAVIDGSPFEAKDDEAFIRHMHHKMAQFMLPSDKLLEWHMKATELLKRADAELQQ